MFDLMWAVCLEGNRSGCRSIQWQAERLPYNLKEKSALRSAMLQKKILAVVADGFDRATFHRFFAARFFFRILRLFVNVGMSTVIVAFEIRRRGFAAQIAIDTLVVDIKFPGDV